MNYKQKALIAWDEAQEAVVAAEQYRALCFETVLRLVPSEEIVEHVTLCNSRGVPEKSEH